MHAGAQLSTPTSEWVRAALAARSSDIKQRRALFSPLPCSLLIVLTHYDRFQDQEPARRAALLSAVAYISHVHGASLLCTSVHDRSSINMVSSSLARADPQFR